MLVFIVRRLAQALLVMLTVAFVAFMLFQYVGDPVTNLLGQDATQEQREALRQDLGLDAPFPVQFARFIGNAVQGEFGLSLRQGRKVSSLIVERFPATLELAMVAGLIALGVGIPLAFFPVFQREQELHHFLNMPPVFLHGKVVTGGIIFHVIYIHHRGKYTVFGVLSDVLVFLQIEHISVWLYIAHVVACAVST